MESSKPQTTYTFCMAVVPNEFLAYAEQSLSFKKFEAIWTVNNSQVRSQNKLMFAFQKVTIQKSRIANALSLVSKKFIL